MKKFEVKECDNRWGAQVFKIVDDNHNYLHSDGVVYPCGEYWPTEEQAQAVLDKFQPKHVWKHGDVFKASWGSVLVYIVLDAESLAYCMLGDYSCSREYTHPSTVTPNTQVCLDNATFLFNIKTVIKDKL